MYFLFDRNYSEVDWVVTLHVCQTALTESLSCQDPLADITSIFHGQRNGCVLSIPRLISPKWTVLIYSSYKSF